MNKCVSQIPLTNTSALWNLNVWKVTLSDAAIYRQEDANRGTPVDHALLGSDEKAAHALLGENGFRSVDGTRAVGVRRHSRIDERLALVNHSRDDDVDGCGAKRASHATDGTE